MSSPSGAARARSTWAVRSLIGAASIAVVLAAFPASAPAATTTLYVDQNNSSCSNTGAGSATQPYCTIGAAATVATAGQTVQVASGTYNEDVKPANSGSAGSPIVFIAAPGATVTVGQGQIDAFTISSRSYITVQGFTVTKTTGYGIAVSGSTNISLLSNTVSFSGQPVSGSTRAGIDVANTNSSTVKGNTSFQNSDHGIYVTGTSTGNTISGNVAYLNAEQYQRNANGINVVAPGNSVIGNITHDNEDSGINVYPGANNTLVADNVTYNNGDHGIDNYNVTGGVIVGNSVFHNCTDGINVEGTSGNYTVENNVSVDNAIAVVNPTPMASGVTNTCNRRTGNIGIYDSAPSTTTANFNVSYMSVTKSAITGNAAVWYDWAGTSYTAGQLASLEGASGQEMQGIWSNPQWKSASVSSPDFHLVEGSPAIDSADSGVSGEQAVDIEGSARVDDPSTANTGIGPRAYDDRGAYEFQPSTGGGTGGGGGTTSTPPSAPQSLTAATGSRKGVALQWSPPSSTGSSAVTGYDVYRSTSSGTETLLTSGVSGTSYQDSGAKRGVTYYYVVTAVNSAGQSPASNEASAVAK